jgi:hypothetical protein
VIGITQRPTFDPARSDTLELACDMRQMSESLDYLARTSDTTWHHSSAWSR